MERKLLVTEKSSYIHDLLPEWTFAKQKWQRTKGAYDSDPNYESAVILPGFQEKRYA